jgi:hypothetical protein
MSIDTGISLVRIETAFDTYKGKTAMQALLEYRLNRLCDLMAEDPSGEIHSQIKWCGLDEFASANDAFISHFGIDIVEFHQQCFLAFAAKKQSQHMNANVD